MKLVSNLTDFICVPAGSFLMGENDDDKFANDTERPRHRVTLRAFQIARAPVTVAEYRRFRPDHEADAPSEWPVVNVSWDEAVEFCEWLGDGIRLPSEAEWEYAARAGTLTPYPWGTGIEPAKANYYYDEQGHKVGVGARTPCVERVQNDWGLCDIIGNVCEWTADSWHPNYQGAPCDGSPWIDVQNDHRVLRGGAWDYLPRLLRVSWRDHLPASTRRDNVGFRLARSISQ